MNEHVGHNDQQVDSYYVESSSDDSLDLLAAVLVKASVVYLLVLRHKVDVIFPNPADLLFRACHILKLWLKTGVFHRTSSFHQEILTECGHNEHALILYFFRDLH
jgi:hypothetical protein